MKKTKKLFLVDGHAYIYRAFYAIKNLSTRSGQPTNAVFGFTNMMLRIIEEGNPDAIIIAFDSGKPSFRKDIYNQYKANRKKMPDELISQLPIIKEVVDGFNIKRIEMDGFEADDILATLALKASEIGYKEIVVYTNDKDVLQIVDKNIFVQTESSNPLKYDIDEVTNRFGNPPERVPDILALAGDNADNIKGVPGVGPKMATSLIRQFGTIDNLLSSLDEVKNDRIRNLLIKHTEDVITSLKLVKLKTDLNIDIDLADLKLEDFNYSKLTELFKELEFGGLVQKIIPKDSPIQDKKYTIINTTDEFNKLLQKLENTKSVSIKIEEYGADIFRTTIIGISFALSSGTAFYIPIGHNYLGMPDQLESDFVFEKLKSIFQNAEIKKIIHDIKTAYLILHSYDIALEGIFFDTMVASYILNPSRKTHNIDELVLEYIGHKIDSKESLIGKGKKEIPLEKIDISILAEYSCEAVDAILPLKNMFSKKISEDSLDYVFYDIEMPLISVLAEMEIEGIKLDEKKLLEIKKQVDVMIEKYQRDIFTLAEEEFNINSPQQLGKILFEKLDLPKGKKGKTGYSTNIEVLKQLAKIHDLPLLVLNFRQLSKLSSTYVEALPRLINNKTGKLHTSFNQTITATGRLSSSNPNLQNIPIRSDFGRLIRQAFVVENPGWTLISGDYSQIELRLLAHFSGDENLLRSFKNNEDIHARTASEIFNISIADVDSDSRRIAKTINFGIIYGMSAFGLSKDLDIAPNEADKYIKGYFAQYPKVKDFIDKTISEAEEKGYVTTLTGRKRYIPELSASNKILHNAGERIAVNTPLQGTAADLIKIAMIKISEELKNRKLKSKMILQIHDELIFEVPPDEERVIIDIIKKYMEDTTSLLVPIKVDIKKGKSWLDMD